ncbi:MAG: uracil-DNA glycosylase [Limnohabitans sp.]|nr:MAG: uracil-DNA glycosylase [Limnohabitans sp.]
MTDPTRFDLDERQRAMLAEMGIRVWWPQKQPSPLPEVTAVRSELDAIRPECGTVRPELGTVRPEPVEGQAASTRLQQAQPERGITQPERGAARTAQVQGAVPAEAVPLPPGVDQMDWDTLQATVAQCRACGLCQSRKNTVFGVGDRSAQWMVIGEAPGENEDLQGEPFVGQAGKLLDNMLKAIGLNRAVEGEQDGQAGVYIANTLKCRPPGNRNPEPVELQTCAPYLARQVALVQPKIILAMGRFAVQSLLQTTEPIGKLRGRVHQYEGVPVVVTYHPAYLLRNPADKAKAWADLVLALQTVQQA